MRSLPTLSGYDNVQIEILPASSVMEKVASLIQEIENVLDNSNEDALKALHYFLQNENIGGLEIGAWALGKPCQIYPLANIVVESTTGLMLFRKLATSPEFVKAVFEVKPSWLKDVLDQTATSLYTSPSPDDLNCCSAVSSCYLPRCEEYLAPSPRYYQEAAASVIQCPNKASLRHLSAIYSSTLTNILDLLDERLLSELSSRCKEVCVNATEDSNVEVMLAQDILAQVAMAFLTPQTQSKNSLETPPAARYSETSRRRMLKLSGDANASSILRLTILRLSLFCSETRKYSPLTVLEAVKLAQRIILPIGRPVRCQWTADAKNSKLLEKFLPRIAYKGLDLNVRLEGVRFCISIFGPEHDMLPDIRKIASEVLVSLCDSECSSSSTITTENDRAIADLLVCLFPPKDSSGNTLASECAFLMSILSFIVDQCQPWQPGSVNAVFKLQQANIILRALYIALSESDILAYIVDFILLDSVPSWWDTEVIFPSSSENTKARNCKKEEVCSKSFDQLHSEVAISFSSLLLIAAWHSNRSLKNSETCQRLLNRLKGSSLKEASLVCSYNGHQIMGFEDIGARTEAQQECVELRERLDNETAQRISLEAQLAKTQKLLDEERDASSAVEQYCQDAERKAFDKSEALKSLKEDYRELLADADRKVKALEDHHRHHDLMLRAEYLGREAKLDAALEEAQDTIKQKEEELQRERDEKEKLSAETERVMAQLREEVEELRRNLFHKTRALEEADALREKLLALLGRNQD